MKKTVWIFLLLLYSSALYAQFDDLSHIDTFIYNKVYKNIAAYNIKNAQYAFNGTADDSPFTGTDHFFYENFLPDLDTKIGMTIEKSPLIYPIQGFEMYQITLHGMAFQNKDRITLTRAGINPGT